MSADSLIQALRCFVAPRGPVQTICCDNGTNFVGAKNELERELKATDKETNPIPSYKDTKKVKLNIWKRIAEDTRKSTIQTVEGETLV